MLPSHRRLTGKRAPSAAALIVACLVAACLPGRQAGGGSETTVAGVSGRVVDEAGNPLAGIAVRIRPENALPPGLLGAAGEGEAEPPAAVTRADGSYRIEEVAAGNYVVECRDSSARAALLAARVADTVEQLPDAVLRATGAIRGRILLPNPEDSLLVAVYVYIPGLPGRAVAQVNVDSLRFLLADIPAGRHVLRVQPAFPFYLRVYQVLELQEVVVEPGDTLVLDSLLLQLRSSVAHPAYTRDSLAMAALLRANGMDVIEVERYSAVTGNRITMIFSLAGEIDRISADVQALDGLEVLYLRSPGSGLSLEVAPEFAAVRGLKRLWLAGHALRGLPAWARTFRELASLKLEYAELDAFPAGVEDFAFLVSLDLIRNSIRSIPPTIARMKRLRVMDMSDNELTELPRELLGMDNLQGFRARNNRLCSLDAEWKAWLTRQDSLWIQQADPLSYYNPGVDSGWEASQRCDAQ